MNTVASSISFKISLIEILLIVISLTLCVAVGHSIFYQNSVGLVVAIYLGPPCFLSATIAAMIYFLKKKWKRLAFNFLMIFLNIAISLTAISLLIIHS